MIKNQITRHRHKSSMQSSGVRRPHHQRTNSGTHTILTENSLFNILQSKVSEEKLLQAEYDKSKQKPRSLQQELQVLMQEQQMRDEMRFKQKQKRNRELLTLIKQQDDELTERAHFIEDRYFNFDSDQEVVLKAHK